MSTIQFISNKNAFKSELSQCRKSLNSLQSLCHNKSLWANLELLRKMSMKISVRLRNSRYSSPLQQISKLIGQLRSLITGTDFLEDLKLFFKNDNKSIREEIVDGFCSQIESLALIQYKMILHSNRAFKLAQNWIDLNQLVNHFLIISCTVSRISVFGKAILVYIYDVYRTLTMIASGLFGTSRDDIIRGYLCQVEIKLRNESSIATGSALSKQVVTSTVTSTADDDNEDVGVPLDRKRYMVGTDKDDKRKKKRRKQVVQVAKRKKSNHQGFRVEKIKK